MLHNQIIYMSWYRRGCGYCSSILDFLELYLRRHPGLERNVTSSLPNQLFQKVEDGRAVATAATVPFCCQNFQKCCVPCLGIIFVCFCLFVGIKPEKLYSASCWEGSKPPGSDHTRTETQTMCVPKTAVQTTYLSIYG